MLHRNSQKRIYIKDAIYFITTNVVEPVYFLKENLFCDLFVADLEFCMKIKQCHIFGYKVNPDHIHLLIQPFGKINYSEIMRSLKLNFSRNANFILGYNEIPNILKLFDVGTAEGAVIDPAFKNNVPTFDEKNYVDFKKHFDFIMNIKTKYSQQYKTNYFTKFRWQSSYHDHFIRDESDYFAHLNYIKNQWKKHQLKENKYCFISNTIPDFLFIQNL